MISVELHRNLLLGGEHKILKTIKVSIDHPKVSEYSHSDGWSCMRMIHLLLKLGEKLESLGA